MLQGLGPASLEGRVLQDLPKTSKPRMPGPPQTPKRPVNVETEARDLALEDSKDEKAQNLESEDASGEQRHEESDSESELLPLRVPERLLIEPQPP